MMKQTEQTMNERIDLLALQALDSKGGLDRHKFAQLIISECVQLCEKQEYNYWRSPEDQEFTPIDCANDIKQHFGVEE
jgi:hypothetical protein